MEDCWVSDGGHHACDMLDNYHSLLRERLGELADMIQLSAVAEDEESRPCSLT